MAAAFWRYKGRNAHGTTWSGNTSTPPAKLAQQRYERGWRELTITTPEGREVGGIDIGMWSGKRGWWAEDHARWCPLADGYNGPLWDPLTDTTDETCHCEDEEQMDLYYDAMDRLDR
jgi:hypothetical protein